jgi:signal transduction histidine kinase
MSAPESSIDIDAIGDIIHELNNVLTAVVSTSDLLTDDLPDSDPNQEDVRDILNAGRRGVELMRKLEAAAGLARGASGDAGGVTREP